MGKKKQIRNGFYFYMQDMMPALRREGRVLERGMADVVPIAHPRWNALPAAEKQRYEDIAKAEKKKAQKGPGVGGDARLDNQGKVIAERVDEKEELDKRRKKESRIAKSRWPEGLELVNHKFYFMSIEMLCRTEQGDFLPCEIGMVEFSLKEGITRTYQKFIEPGHIPLGYRFTCQDHSDSTHQIPIENFDKADNNYRGILIQLENFINPSGAKPEYPPIYVVCAELEIAEYTLDLLQARAMMGHASKINKIYELENMISDIMDHYDSKLPLNRQMALECLNRPLWDYKPNTKCEWHEEIETKHCALFTVRRYAYALSELASDKYNIKLENGKHRPPTDNEPTFQAKQLGGAFSMKPGDDWGNFSEPVSRSTPRNLPPRMRDQAPVSTSAWDKGEGSGKAGVFPARDYRFQDADDVEDYTVQVAEPLRKPRDDFGPASSAWGMPAASASPPAAAGRPGEAWSAANNGAGRGAGGEAWPSLGGPVGRGRGQYAGRAGAPSASKAPAPPRSWADHASRDTSDTSSVCSAYEPYVVHAGDGPEPVTKPSLHAAARQREADEAAERMRQAAPAPAPQRATNSPQRPVAIGRGVGGFSNPRDKAAVGGFSNPRDKARGGNAARAAGRGAGRAVPPKVNVPTVGSISPANGMSHSPTFTEPNSEIGGGSVRVPASMPAVLSVGGRVPKNMPQVLANNPLASAGIGRGRGMVNQPATVPVGLQKPPPGIGRGISTHMAAMGLQEDFS